MKKLSLVLCLLCLPTSASGDPIVNTPLYKLTRPDAEDYYNFGASLAIEGSILAVSSRGTNGRIGHVELFDLATGTYIRTLEDPPADTDNHSYGSVMTINGGQILIGNSDDSTFANEGGSAHLYDMSTGNVLRSYYPNDPGATDSFGGSGEAMTATHVLVGNAYNGGLNDGAAYLFDRATGTQLAKFTHDPLAYFYGRSVALTDRYAIVGSAKHTPPATADGFVDVYDLQTNTLVWSIDRPNGSEWFSRNLVAEGNLLVVGSLSDAAYVYDLESRTHIDTITDGTSETTWLGLGMDLEGGNLLLGSYRVDNSRGEALLISALGEETVFQAPDREAYDLFGAAVAIGGNYVAIAARQDDDQGTNSGAVYVFSVPEPSSLTALLTLMVLGLTRRLYGGRRRTAGVSS